jgi:hypothetical protein
MNKIIFLIFNKLKPTYVYLLFFDKDQQLSSLQCSFSNEIRWMK